MIITNFMPLEMSYAKYLVTNICFKEEKILLKLYFVHFLILHLTTFNQLLTILISKPINVYQPTFKSSPCVIK